MLPTDHDFFLALAAARKAMRRGDFHAADRWMKLAERHLKVMRQLSALATEEGARNRMRALE